MTTECYEYFITRTGLREQILVELNRKDFREALKGSPQGLRMRCRNRAGTFHPYRGNILKTAADPGKG